MIWRSPSSLNSLLLLTLGHAIPAIAWAVVAQPALAQLPAPGEIIRPRPSTLPEVEPRPQDDDRDRLEIPTSPTSPSPEAVPLRTFAVKAIVIRGNTAFTDEDLIQAIEALEQLMSMESATLADLFVAAEAITRYYEEQNYPTTGAAPVIELEGAELVEVAPDGVVTFEVFEGEVEAIEVYGTERLNPEYVRSRLDLATDPPVSSERLKEALQLLHDDPLIDNVQATLTAGTSGVGRNILRIEVQEADSFDGVFSLNNRRSPLVSTFQQGVQLQEGNLLGWGDRASIGYNRTEGSDVFSLGYSFPLNPRQGTLSFSYSHADSHVVEPSIDDVVDIDSSANYLDVTWRQPLIRKPHQEFALGVTGSYRQSRTVLSIPGFSTGLPAGDGRSQSTAVRFFQDWVSRTPQDAIALRSEFSFGFNAQEPTLDGKDIRDFFSWRGQAQYQRRLGDALLVVRGDIQLANEPLIPIERFSLGGNSSVRGYRQSLLLADNGAFASAEVRIPVLRLPELEGTVQIIPFLEGGTVWNNNNDFMIADELASVGLGLQWQTDDVVARLDWAIPLISVDVDKTTWQENGIHFSISYTGL